MTRHHRKPSSIGGTDDEENISIVPFNQHCAWHLLFANHSAETIAAIINERWLDTDYMFICVPRKKKRKR
jgi:hypothetical protein